MRILVVNCGSSTLKFRVVEMTGAAQEVVVSGSVDRIGARSTLSIDGRSLRDQVDAPDHRAAAIAVLERIGDLGVGAVVHRIVHGGEGSDEAVIVDEGVTERIESLRELAPLHNGPALDALTACRERLGDVPTIAVFDTAFHSQMPERASRYAIPNDRVMTTSRNGTGSNASDSTASPTATSSSATPRSHRSPFRTHGS